VRGRSDFRGLYFIVERVMALMMFGLEYSLNPNLVAIAQAGVPPCEDSDSTRIRSGLAI